MPSRVQRRPEAQVIASLLLPSHILTVQYSHSSSNHTCDTSEPRGQAIHKGTVIQHHTATPKRGIFIHRRNRYSGVESCHRGAGCDPDGGAPTSHLRQLQRPVVDLQRGPQVE